MPIVYIIILILYCYWCYSTAVHHSKKRKVDVDWGFILCLFTSPLIGGLIMAFGYPERIKQPVKPSRPLVGVNNNLKNGKLFFIKMVASAKNLKTKFHRNGRRKKNVLIVTACLMVIMILTNPGYSRFKEFTPSLTNKSHYSLRKRVNNFLIFSIYEVKVYDSDYYDDIKETSSLRYIGIFMNFYKIR